MISVVHFNGRKNNNLIDITSRLYYDTSIKRLKIQKFIVFCWNQLMAIQNVRHRNQLNIYATKEEICTKTIIWNKSCCYITVTKKYFCQISNSIEHICDEGRILHKKHYLKQVMLLQWPKNIFVKWFQQKTINFWIIKRRCSCRRTLANCSLMYGTCTY